MNESRATRYQRLRRRAHAAGVVSAGVMLAVTAFTPLSRWLSHFALSAAAGRSGPIAEVLALGVFVAMVVALWELASLPALIYVARRVDEPYGQPALSVEELLGAQARATLMAVPLALAAGGSVLLAVGVAGRWWWIIAGCLWALFLAAALRLAPILFAALGPVRPLHRPDLQRRLAELARKARTPIGRVDEWLAADVVPTAAFVTGVGQTRRVMVSSELVRTWSDDEILVVVAHELAHHVYRDLWRTLFLDVVVLWVSLAAADVVVRWTSPAMSVAGPGDLAALPVIALVASVVWTVATPIRHAQSRRQERRADTFALTMTDGAEAFGSAIRRLGVARLAEERPTALTRWLYHRHPSVVERLALADAYRRVSETRVS